MALARHEIPLLEYDDNPRAVIAPQHDRLGIELPRKAAFPFLGDAVGRYAEAHGAPVVARFESATKSYPVYVVGAEGEEVCLVQAPVGAAAATQILDWMIAYGVREVISAGSCGVLDERDENLFLVPRRALRDEGTSYHYLPPSRFVEVSPVARRAVARTLAARGLDYEEVITWSTDGFYRETEEKVAYRRSEGCAVVEMECSALAACAELRGAVWGELLYTADTLADARRYDERDWGLGSVDLALDLCIEAVRAI